MHRAAVRSLVAGLRDTMENFSADRNISKNIVEKKIEADEHHYTPNYFLYNLLASYKSHCQLFLTRP